MCTQLFQYYACGHSKPICLTPCPHALTTGKRIPVNKDGTDLSRSDSTVSSSGPSVRRSNIADLHSHVRSPRSPLCYMETSSPGKPASTVASRSPSSSSQASAAIGPPSSYSSTAKPYTTSSPPPVPVTRWSIYNPDPPRPASPPTPTIPALPDEAFIIEPNFCPYHFPRDLPQSNYPCMDCYFLPTWAHLADRYVKSYREGHPLNRSEEAERMSGIERMRSEFAEEQGQGKEGMEGLLNVLVHGEDGRGRVG